MNSMPRNADFANPTAATYDRLDMEGDLADLAQMARIAEQQLCEVIGHTEFKYSGRAGTVFEVVRHDLSPDGVTQARFVVSHVAKMIEAIQKKHGMA